MRESDLTRKFLLSDSGKITTADSSPHYLIYFIVISRANVIAIVIY